MTYPRFCFDSHFGNLESTSNISYPQVNSWYSRSSLILFQLLQIPVNGNENFTSKELGGHLLHHHQVRSITFPKYFSYHRLFCMCTASKTFPTVFTAVMGILNRLQADPPAFTKIFFNPFSIEEWHVKIHFWSCPPYV